MRPGLGQDQNIKRDGICSSFFQRNVQDGKDENRVMGQAESIYFVFENIIKKSTKPSNIMKQPEADVKAALKIPLFNFSGSHGVNAR